MDDEELIARLRDACRGGDECKCSLSEAADRIEALRAERDAAEQRGYANAMEAERKLHEDRIERLEAALRGLMMHEPDHPDTLWQEARAALKGAEHDG